MVSIKIEKELPTEFLSDIMITAFDGSYGACWYWSEPDRRNKPWLVTNSNSVASESRWFTAFIQDKEDEAERWEVNHEVIAKGIERIISGEVEIASYIQNYVQDSLVEYDAGDIDASAADCIVQAGLFGELVYG
jgi:hypothetical protein